MTTLDRAQPVCYSYVMTALQFLLDSRAHIDKPYKWTKHTLLSPTGSVCALGALQQTFVENTGHKPKGGTVENGNEWMQGDMLAAGNYLAEALGVPHLEPGQFFSYIANFNDADGVSYYHVLAIFDRAIELAKADEEIETISVAELIEELAPA